VPSSLAASSLNGAPRAGRHVVRVPTFGTALRLRVVVISDGASLVSPCWDIAINRFTQQRRIACGAQWHDCGSSRPAIMRKLLPIVVLALATAAAAHPARAEAPPAAARPAPIPPAAVANHRNAPGPPAPGYVRRVPPPPRVSAASIKIASKLAASVNVSPGEITRITRGKTYDELRKLNDKDLRAIHVDLLKASASKLSVWANLSDADVARVTFHKSPDDIRALRDGLIKAAGQYEVRTAEEADWGWAETFADKGRQARVSMTAARILTMIPNPTKEDYQLEGYTYLGAVREFDDLEYHFKEFRGAKLEFPGQDFRNAKSDRAQALSEAIKAYQAAGLRKFPNALKQYGGEYGVTAILNWWSPKPIPGGRRVDLW